MKQDRLQAFAKLPKTVAEKGEKTKSSMCLSGAEVHPRARSHDSNAFIC